MLRRFQRRACDPRSHGPYPFAWLFLQTYWQACMGYRGVTQGPLPAQYDQVPDKRLPHGAQTFGMERRGAGKDQREVFRCAARRH